MTSELQEIAQSSLPDWKPFLSPLRPACPLQSSQKHWSFFAWAPAPSPLCCLSFLGLSLTAVSQSCWPSGMSICLQQKVQASALPKSCTSPTHSFNRLQHKWRTNNKNKSYTVYNVVLMVPLLISMLATLTNISTFTEEHQNIYWNPDKWSILHLVWPKTIEEHFQVNLSRSFLNKPHYISYQLSLNFHLSLPSIYILQLSMVEFKLRGLKSLTPLNEVPHLLSSVMQKDLQKYLLWDL